MCYRSLFLVAQCHFASWRRDWGNLWESLLLSQRIWCPSDSEGFKGTLKQCGRNPIEQVHWKHSCLNSPTSVFSSQSESHFSRYSKLKVRSSLDELFRQTWHLPSTVAAKPCCMQKPLCQPQQHLRRQYMETIAIFDGFSVMCDLEGLTPSTYESFKSATSNI